MLTHGSLFTGIGGIDRGFEAAGIKTIWQVENDTYALKVLEKHWPDVTRYNDITQVDFTQVEKPDILSGGFPCQDVSYAGKRAGIEGGRSGLWREFYRAICEIRPRFVVVENVPGLLSSGFGRILGDLAASGYDAEWDCLPAAAFGAPHLRYRVFIVAYPATNDAGRIYRKLGSSQEKEIKAGNKFTEEFICRGQAANFVADAPRECGDGSGGTRQRGAEFTDGGDAMAFAQEPGLQGNESTGNSRAGGCLAECDWWTVEPDVGRVANGVPSRVDRLKCLGNAVVPQVAEYIGRLIVKHVG